MRARSFGGFTVSLIGQGAGGDSVCDDQHRVKVLQYGIDMGMTLIDTAESYSSGLSEVIVGRAVRGRRGKVFISTKFSPARNQYNAVVKALEGSLRRLNTDYVDLYQVHWPNPSVSIEETMRVLVDLKDSGKVLHIGVSNFSLRQFLEAQKVCGTKIESNQVEYNLLERGIEEDLLPHSMKNGIMTIAYNPLLRGKKGAVILDALAKKHGKTQTQVVLNWLISHDTIVPIPKTLSLEHARENALAANFRLDLEDIAELDRMFKRVVVRVSTDRIRVLPSDRELVYTTLEEALENRFNLEPSPRTIALEIFNNQILKPVRLSPSTDTMGKYDYDLVQGRVRYWAWIIAHGTGVPIPASVYD